MSLTKDEIEYLHDTGLMPDMYYYQVNGKTAEENYITIYRKRQKQLKKFMEERQLNKEIEKEIDAAVEKAIEKSLNKIF